MHKGLYLLCIIFSHSGSADPSMLPPWCCPLVSRCFRQARSCAYHANLQESPSQASCILRSAECARHVTLLLGFRLQVPSPAPAVVPTPSAALSAAMVPSTAPTPAPAARAPTPAPAGTTPAGAPPGSAPGLAHAPAPVPSGTTPASAPPGSAPGLAQAPTPAPTASAPKPTAAALPPGVLPPTALAPGPLLGDLNAPAAAPTSIAAGPQALDGATSQILPSGAPAMAPGPSPAGVEPPVQLQPSSSPESAPLNTMQSQAPAPSGISLPVPASAPLFTVLTLGPGPGGQPGSLAPFSMPSNFPSASSPTTSPSAFPPTASQSAWPPTPSLPPEAYLQGGRAPETPMMPSRGPAADSPAFSPGNASGVSTVRAAPLLSTAKPPVTLFPRAVAPLPKTLVPGMQPPTPSAVEAQGVVDSSGTALGSASTIETPLEAIGLPAPAPELAPAAARGAMQLPPVAALLLPVALPALGDAVFLAQGPASSGPAAAPQDFSPTTGQSLIPAAGPNSAENFSQANSVGALASYFGPSISQPPSPAADASIEQTASPLVTSASIAQAPSPAASAEGKQSAPTQAPVPYVAAANGSVAAPAEAPSLQSKNPSVPLLPAAAPAPEEPAAAAGGRPALPQHRCMAQQLQQQQQHEHHQGTL